MESLGKVDRQIAFSAPGGTDNRNQRQEFIFPRFNVSGGHVTVIQ